MPRHSRLVAALTALLLIAFVGTTFAAPPVKDVNVATATELTTVKGIGEKTAAKIIAEREKTGPFASLEDMQSRVKGVGEKAVAHFKADGWVAVAGAKPSPEDAKAPGKRK